MTRFPPILKEDKAGEIPLPSDLGLDILSEEVFKYIPEATISNDKISRDRVREKIRNWLHCFETTPEAIAERQEVTSYALKDPAFLRIIDRLAVYPNQSSDRDDNFSKYTGMLRRFETFAEGVTSLREILSGPDIPRPLAALLKACEQAEESIQDATRKLDPEFELRIEVDGDYGTGVILQLASSIREGKCNFAYVLLNKATSSIKRGEYLSYFGIFTSRRHDYFLEELDKCIGEALIRTLKKTPFLKRVYRINGELKYNQSEAKVEGHLHFQKGKSKEQGTFFVSFGRDYNDTPRSIIEMARFVHNYQVISPFENMIADFEDTILELKALSAISHFFINYENRGYPLTFPEIIRNNPDENPRNDLYISKLYHPLLALSSKKVIPNNVETFPGRNVTLITGANNNGKTCYIAGLGLSQALFQAGLPIVAKTASLKIKDKILTHFVRPGDIGLNQSRFAHECERVLKLIEAISSDSLILCDEIFTGTAPQDGEVVSRLVLNTLLQTRATLLFVTHYHALGTHFRNSPYVCQLCCTLDHSTDPPGYTYKIKPGVSDDSDGLVIASEYGINVNNLKNLIAQKSRRGDIRVR